MEIDPVACHSQQETMDQILSKQCAALVVDFDSPGAAEIAKLASLLEPSQRPAVMAMAGAWPGSGQAFQSGANRILYKPLDPLQVKDAFEIAGKATRRDARNAPRYRITSVVWLDLETGTLPAVAVNISEHGMAIRTTERLRIQGNVSFRCTLPGSEQLHGYADVIWSDDVGCAGMFFSRLSLSARKHLKDWLRLRAKTAHGRNESKGFSGRRKKIGKLMTQTGNAGSGSVRDLLSPTLA
ncbi:MAG: PilZ domain-containing protein [Candidatus Sulfotelmatobacter sp.]